MIARLTIAGIREQLDTLARHYGCTITIERTNKDGNANAAGRYVNVIVPSGVTKTGIIVTNLGEARDTIRQYLAQTNIIPSTDTFPSDNLTAAIAAHHARYLATIAADPQPEPAPPSADPYASIPAIGGGSHDADTWTRHYIRTGTIANTSTEILTSDDVDFSTETLAIVMSAPYYDCVIERNSAGELVHITYSLDTYDGGHERFTYTRNTDRYADLPPIGGGSHDADATPSPEFIAETEAGELLATGDHDTCYNAACDYVASPIEQLTPGGVWQSRYVRRGVRTIVRHVATNARAASFFNAWQAEDTGTTYGPAFIPASSPDPEPSASAKKPRTATTSQKRDNQRAARAAINEAYHASATTHAPELATILADLGFTIVETIERGDTPVTIWQSDDATIKQTPYTIRVYNGQPKRLPRHGDAEIINSVEAGWIMRTQPTGYASGIVAAILPLIETPDPYMQATEAGGAEQSAPMPAGCRMCAKRAALNGDGYCSKCDAILADYPPRFAEAMTSYALDDDEMPADEETANAYTLATRSPEGGRQTIIAVSHHSIPNPVLIGGQPSMSGPWQVPVISGGSHDADTIACADCGITSDDTDVQPVRFGDRAPRCWECSATYHAMISR